MINKTSFTATFLILFFLLTGLVQNVYTKKNGTPTDQNDGNGYTGGKMENGRTCATTNCHNGPDAYRDSIISIPTLTNGEYIPNTDYLVAVVITKQGNVKFGYQASPQTLAGTSAGNLAAINANSQLNIGNEYITHTAAGNTGNTTKVWTFNWTAPPAGTDTVNFFVAVNVANNNDSSTGDQIYFDTLVIGESPLTGLSDLSENSFEAFLNPVVAHNEIQISVSNEELNGLQLEIIDWTGKLVYKKHLKNMIGFNNIETIDISAFGKGHYFLRLENDAGSKVLRFLKL